MGRFLPNSRSVRQGERALCRPYSDPPLTPPGGGREHRGRLPPWEAPGIGGGASRGPRPPLAAGSASGGPFPSADLGPPRAPTRGQPAWPSSAGGSLSRGVRRGPLLPDCLGVGCGGEGAARDSRLENSGEQRAAQVAATGSAATAAERVQGAGSAPRGCRAAPPFATLRPEPARAGRGGKPAGAGAVSACAPGSGAARRAVCLVVPGV